jgi:hypothetical protein
MQRSKNAPPTGHDALEHRGVVRHNPRGRPMTPRVGFIGLGNVGEPTIASDPGQGGHPAQVYQPAA